MKNILAILFDVDGVLVDATNWHFEAFNSALEPFGFAISRQQHQQEFLGLPTAIKIDRLVAGGVLPGEARASVLEAKRRYFREIARDRCQPNDDRRYALAALRAQGFLLAAASNAIRESVMEMLDLSQLTSYFNAIVCGDDVVHAKPAPELYVLCTKMLGVRPDQCLAVEDGVYGIQAARAAGIRVLAVKTIADVSLPNLMSALGAAYQEPSPLEGVS